jgi:uncharacterized protein (TIGR03067 family)
MKLCISAALMVCLFAGAAPATKSVTKIPSDVQKLQGTWKLVGGEMEGKTMTEEQLKTGKLIIRGDQFTITLPGQGTSTGVQTLNATKLPKTIDIKDESGVNAGKSARGIYELKGDEFRVTFAPSNKARPTQFKTKPGSECWSHVWSREEQK